MKEISDSQEICDVIKVFFFIDEASLQISTTEYLILEFFFLGGGLQWTVAVWERQCIMYSCINLEYYHGNEHNMEEPPRAITPSHVHVAWYCSVNLQIQSEPTVKTQAQPP